MTGRLFARLTDGAGSPVGEVWRDTAAALPAPAPGTRYREALTGRAVTPTMREGIWELALSEVFETLPLALVVEEAP